MNTIIYRHRKENKKKCTLSPLENREDIIFFKYPKDILSDLFGYIILTINAPILTIKEKERPIFLIDATWRYSKKMLDSLPNKEKLIYRSIPKIYKSAYPRKQTDCPDPTRGLASIEALFLANYILKRKTDGLLDNYHWKDEFLKINHLPYLQP